MIGLVVWAHMTVAQWEALPFQAAYTLMAPNGGYSYVVRGGFRGPVKRFTVHSTDPCAVLPGISYMEADKTACRVRQMYEGRSAKDYREWTTEVLYDGAYVDLYPELHREATMSAVKP